ncbi:hypothetical protein BD779DRAFT_841963 [Infundibulicybe gibba]|nr:hypothetical protein BD779DRAFT_841963 [Infundibulicybe gibba]
MSSTRLHHSLPAPVVHAGFSVSQSKSHVLAGVQDAYWSDEEAEDAECPLCLEEMDISDLNFKPCICGYQICRFCWHHIKENLNKRCPACRRVYTDDAVEFKPIATQDHKRLTQQKKQRERERKELETLGRRHLANVRVVQRNVVYVVGIGPRFAKEELIPTLRSNEYFGQYGKITKILLVKRTPSGGGAPVVGLYITYHRREDAARAIHAVDGTASPGGGREVMRASYGTTKYCMAFLRSVSCSDHGCMNLHEWGDEKDCFTKEDLTTLKHTMKATESQARTVVSKKDESEGLPRAASWAHKGTSNATLIPAAPISNSVVSTAAATVRSSRRNGTARLPRNPPAAAPSTSSRTPQDRKLMNTTTKTLSQASSSRPPTPAGQAPPQRPATPPDVRALRPNKETPPPPPESPTTSTAADSDHIESHSFAPLTNESSTPGSTSSPSLSVPILPPGLPIVPPGLAAPPGLSSPSRPPRVETASPQTPLLASQSSYQMSNAARALLDDVKARRESALPVSSGLSPFPDFDRTLQTLTAGDGSGFSFNLDPKLAGDSKLEEFADFEVEENIPFRGTYVDAFPAIRPALPNAMAPPGLSYPHNPSRSIFDPLAVRNTSVLPMERQSSGSSNYMGSFNPFADGADDVSANLTDRPSSYVSLDDDAGRKVSRFGFARGRQGPAAAPPSHPSPLSNNSNDTHSIYSSTEPAPQHTTPHWPQLQLDQSYGRSNSNGSSPLMHHNQPHFVNDRGMPPFDATISEAQLRDFIQSSRDRAGLSGNSHPAAAPNAQLNRSQFHDPAIMSASFSPNRPGTFTQMSYGPPPGLSYPSQHPPPMVTHNNNSMNTDANDHAPSLVALSSSDFPALTAAEPSSRREENPTADMHPETSVLKSQEIADRRAAKKAAATEKAAERQRIALEKMNAKAAEKAKVAAEKAVEKERATLVKAQQQLAAQEAAEAKEAIIKAKAQSTRNLPEPERQRPQAKRSLPKLVDLPKANRTEPVTVPAKLPAKQKSHPVLVEPITQVPLLSKKPKKVKPATKPIRVPHKDEGTIQDDTATLPSATASDAPCLPPTQTMNSSSSNSRSQSLERNTPTTIAELLEEIALSPSIDLSNHPFFDTHKINPAAKMPLEYGPLVHALSALSVGGGSFANNMPSGSIDNAVSSFQQLLETLTQTISDLLRLLPRTTWDDSSSFDGVLRDMLKGDDFLDDGGDDGQGKEDEVAALTLALERRARWMEVQLSKLEELHRDINTAAVRAVLSFNDNGWDRHGFMPQVGNTLRRFDSIGVVEENGAIRLMNPDELEKKLVVAKEAAVFAETEVREMMEKMRALRPVENDSI